jgi:hypothetical protein
MIFHFTEEKNGSKVIAMYKTHNMEYSASQNNAINTFLSLCFTVMYLLAPGGYGKSTVTRECITRLLKNKPDLKISVVATTTIAAEVLGEIGGIRAITFHKWWQIGAYSLRMHDEHFMRDVLSRMKPENPLNTDILFIDEVSMLTVQILEVMDRLLKWYRKTPNVRFGGMKIILIGDPLQLQPVAPSAGPGLQRDIRLEATSCVSILDDHVGVVYQILNEPHRCKDRDFQIMLRQLLSIGRENRRLAMENFDKHYQPGFETPDKIARMAKEKGAIVAVHTNEMVERINAEVRKYLIKEKKSSFTLDGVSKLFTDADVRSVPVIEGIDTADQLDREEQAITIERKRFFLDVIIYEGQVVQIRMTHTSENNVIVTIGELCTFIELIPGTEKVRLVRKKDNKELIIKKQEAQSEYWEEMKWSGYPFILADASTIHLLQGSTVTGPLIFYSNISGTIYGELPFYLNVAASRVTDPANFIITHRMGKYALDAQEITDRLESIWRLSFMDKYPQT